jgi:hypothetical protein
MPLSVRHRDRFQIELSHSGKTKVLPTYDKPAVSNGARDNTSQVIEHAEGGFSDPTCKAYIAKTLPTPLKVSPILEPGFDFLSGNAVLFELSTVAAGGRMSKVLDFGRILKSNHQIRRPKDSTVCFWTKVPTSEAGDGTMVISVIRGNSNGMEDHFVPLSDEERKPYVVEIEWQSLASVSSGEKNAMGVQSDAVNGTISTPPAASPRHAETSARASKTSSKEPVSQDSARPDKEDESMKSTLVQGAKQPQASQDHVVALRTTTEPFAGIQEENQQTPNTLKAKAPPSILHRDHFAVEVLQGQQALTVHDSEDVPQAHVRNFAGLSKKVHVFPASTRTIKMKLNLLPGFDFLSGDVVCVGLNDDGMNRAPQSIQLNLAKARAEEIASEVGTEDVRYLQASLNDAEAAHEVIKVELEFGDKEEKGFKKLLTRKAEADLALVEAEEKLELAVESQR